MPELYFRVRWSDGETQRCYSPSGRLAEIERVAATYDSEPGATVTVQALRHAHGSDR
ncbi:MAG: hypothetical protein QOE54_3761 [Streptosporangiaceae bacterium]|nr:family nitrogen starvation response protein [Streptosporangiaceae bacterium]MDX6431395.1 hypothetical protein [Streptosporangiaceae bacterium]